MLFSIYLVFSGSVTFTFLMLKLKKKKTGTTILVLSYTVYTSELIVQILGFSSVFFLPKKAKFLQLY